MARNSGLTARHLTDRVEALSPGIYTADSNTDAYGSLLAAVATGAAKFLGESYPEPGLKSVAVQVAGGARRNPGEPDLSEVGEIIFAEEFYTKALTDYEPFQRMWFREAIQNSVDAGLSKGGSVRIAIDVKEQPDGTALVSVEDDGGGMDEDTLRKKFLALGPTGKAGVAGAAGGFGEAKRLLILPWLSYEVHTRNLIVRGKFAQQRYEFTREATNLDGTRLTVRMPADKRATADDARWVVEHCYLPQARITLNGERIYADLDDGDEADEFKGLGKARLHYKPRGRKAKGFFVRKNGIFMFERPIASDLPGYFTMEILAKSTDVLYGNRMALRDWSLEGAVSEYLRLLARDSMKATQKKRNVMKRKWRGSGKFRGRAEGELKALILQKIGAAEKVVERENIEAVKQLLAGNEEKRAEEVESAPTAPEGAETKPAEPGTPTVPTSPLVPERIAPADGPTGPEFVREVPPGYRPLRPGEELPPGSAVKYLLLPPGEPASVIVNRVLPPGVEPLPGSDVGEVREVVVIGGEEDDEEGSGGSRPTFAVAPDVAEMILKALGERGVKGPDQVEAIVQNLAWEPDFYIEATIEEFRVPVKFEPEKMTVQIRKLAKFWAEVSRTLIAASEKPGMVYGVGWIFKEEWDSENHTWGATRGEYIRDEEGEEWLMLNPFRAGSIKGAELYSLRNDADLKLIHAIALHEVTHLLGYHGHDDKYAGALTDNVARMSLTLTELRAIRDVVVRRPPGWKPTPRRKAIRFQPDAEEKVKELEKGFKKSHYEYVSLPPKPGEEAWERWIADIDYEGDGTIAQLKVEMMGHRGANTLVVAKTEPQEGSQKAADLLLPRIRSIIAKRRPDLVLADLSDASREFLDRIKKKVVEDVSGSGSSAPAAAFSEFTPAGKKVRVTAHRYYGDQWNVRAEYEYISLYDETIKSARPGEDKWVEKVARAVMAKVGPLIAAKLAKEEA